MNKHNWYTGCRYLKLEMTSIVAIRNPERHVRKASHRGSKQQ